MRRYVEKITGLSRVQTTRLITVYLGDDEVEPQAYRRRRFPQRYTWEDIGLLAGLDAVHETLSGPATKKLLQRASYNFGDRRYLSEFGVHLGGAVVPIAGESGVPGAPDQVSGDETDAAVDRGSGENRSREGGPVACASPRCIRAVGMGLPAADAGRHAGAVSLQNRGIHFDNGG